MSKAARGRKPRNYFRTHRNSLRKEVEAQIARSDALFKCPKCAAKGEIVSVTGKVAVYRCPRDGKTWESRA